MTPWISTAAAAAHMGVSTDTVLRLAKGGRLPHKKVGRQYRFVPGQLDAWEGSDPVPSRTPAPAADDWRRDLAALNPYAA